MAAAVDVLRLANGKATPKHKDNACALLRQCLYGGIGEQFPATVLVRACLMGTHGERGVEQQHALFGPTCEVAAGEWNIGA